MKISYGVAPFGLYPFGREIMGQLMVEKSLGCRSFKMDNSTRDPNMPVFIMLQEGECSARLKANNAEKSGADVLIIYKN